MAVAQQRPRTEPNRSKIRFPYLKSTVSRFVPSRRAIKTPRVQSTHLSPTGAKYNVSDRNKNREVNFRWGKKRNNFFSSLPPLHPRSIILLKRNQNCERYTKNTREAVPHTPNFSRPRSPLSPIDRRENFSICRGGRYHRNPLPVTPQVRKYLRPCSGRVKGLHSLRWSEKFSEKLFSSGSRLTTSCSPSYSPFLGLSV